MIEGNTEVMVPYETIEGDNMISTFSEEVSGSTWEGNPDFYFNVRWVHPGGVVSSGWPKDFADQPESDEVEIVKEDMNNSLGAYVTELLRPGGNWDEFALAYVNCIDYRHWS